MTNYFRLQRKIKETTSLRETQRLKEEKDKAYKEIEKISKRT